MIFDEFIEIVLDTLYHRAPIFQSKMKRIITGGLQRSPDEWIDRNGKMDFSTFDRDIDIFNEN